MAVPALNTPITADLDFLPGAEIFSILHLDSDGSRLIVNISVTTASGWMRGERELIIPKGLPAVTWAADSVVQTNRVHIGQYLPYPPDDGIGIPSTPDPVNQIPYLAEWWPHIGRAAHGFDTIFHSRSMLALNETTREVLRKTVQGLIGEARFRITTFAAIDPLGTWRAGIPWVEVAIQTVCDDCSSATAVRQIGRNINVARFAAELANGKIYGADKTVKPWVPGTLVRSLNQEDAQSESSLASFFSSLEAQYEQVLDWYDTHIAHLEAPHGHDA